METNLLKLVMNLSVASFYPTYEEWRGWRGMETTQKKDI